MGRRKKGISNSFAKLTLHFPKVWTQLVIIWREIFFFGCRHASFPSSPAFMRRAGFRRIKTRWRYLL
jgi:hypothetical protein